MASTIPATAAAPAANTPFFANVKQVISGDQIVVWRCSRLPTEQTVTFSNIVTPKLGRVDKQRDEPYAWEAREFLRRKLVGNDVSVVLDSSNNNTNLKLGYVLLGSENITESLVSEGLASVRQRIPEDRKKLTELEEKAKLAQKNIWDESSKPLHVRDLKASPSNLNEFVNQQKKKPIKAIIEHVHDGSKFRVVLLPDFYHITLMLTGIRCFPIKDEQDESDEAKFGREARNTVETLILQRDIEVILESASLNAFYGTVVFPRGNISTVLLRSGLANCHNQSISSLTSGVADLRAAEKHAKDNKARIWQNYKPKPTLTGKEKEFTGTVVEIVSGDALMIKSGSDKPKKYFLSNIRPPRAAKPAEDAKDGPPAARRTTRPLYEVPWLFEAREFLRKKLIGKKVNVSIDYTSPASEKLPEKICCTVQINGVNVAEALVSKGLATVVRPGNSEEPHANYDLFFAAEEKARKSGKGVHNKKDVPQHRFNDLSADGARARTFLTSLQRSGRVEAVVEFVTSGSRLRLYIPKDSCLITFLLAGIKCPRGSRQAGPSGTGAVPAEPFGDEALQLTRDRVMQREVEISVIGTDKAGNFIGWLWIDGNNLSVALVEEGLAEVHFSAERTEHYRALKMSEDSAKARKANRWANYVEEEKPEEKVEEDLPDRKVDYQNVVVTEVTNDLRFYAQNVDQGPKLEALMTNMRQEFQANPPLPGAYTPKRGDMCAAKFGDDEWYRARVERTQAGQVHVIYVDYGNREVTSAVRCASLPANFTTDKPYANEFTLAFVKLPPEADDQHAAIDALRTDVEEKTLVLNIEYKIEKTVYATLADATTKADVGKGLVAEAFLLVDARRDRRLQKIVSEYKSAQDEARKAHKGIWQYGDITEDDAKEFGR